MIGGYILINGEILMQIDSDDPDNPTIISEEDYYKIYNAVKLGKEIRVEYNGLATPVIASNYDDDFCALTFAETAHGSVFLYTIMIGVTVDDTDPDNPVYTYSGIMKDTEVGGGGNSLYLHRIKYRQGGVYLFHYVISTQSEPFTHLSLRQFLIDNNYDSSTRPYTSIFVNAPSIVKDGNTAKIKCTYVEGIWGIDYDCIMQKINTSTFEFSINDGAVTLNATNANVQWQSSASDFYSDTVESIY